MIELFILGIVASFVLGMVTLDQIQKHQEKKNERITQKLKEESRISDLEYHVKLIARRLGYEDIAPALSEYQKSMATAAQNYNGPPVMGASFNRPLTGNSFGSNLGDIL